MKQIKFILCMLLVPVLAQGAEIERAIEILEKYGIYRPFSEEVVIYAVFRRELEDGPSREKSISMNGMVPGGINKDVMQRLCPEWDGHVVSVVSSYDGQGSYCIRGPNAHAYSTAAIVLLWDLYFDKFNIKSELKYAWKESIWLCGLARQMQWFCNTYSLSKYYSLKKDRTKSFEKVNCMYGPGCESLNKRARKVVDMGKL